MRQGRMDSPLGWLELGFRSHAGLALGRAAVTLGALHRLDRGLDGGDDGRDLDAHLAQSEGEQVLEGAHLFLHRSHGGIHCLADIARLDPSLTVDPDGGPGTEVAGLVLVGCPVVEVLVAGRLQLLAGLGQQLELLHGIVLRDGFAVEGDPEVALTLVLVLLGSVDDEDVVALDEVTEHASDGLLRVNGHVWTL